MALSDEGFKTSGSKPLTKACKFQYSHFLGASLAIGLPRHSSCGAIQINLSSVQLGQNTLFWTWGRHKFPLKTSEMGSV